MPPASYERTLHVATVRNGDPPLDPFARTAHDISSGRSFGESTVRPSTMIEPAGQEAAADEGASRRTGGRLHLDFAFPARRNNEREDLFSSGTFRSPSWDKRSGMKGASLQSIPNGAQRKRRDRAASASMGLCAHQGRYPERCHPASMGPPIPAPTALWSRGIRLSAPGACSRGRPGDRPGPGRGPDRRPRAPC